MPHFAPITLSNPVKDEWWTILRLLRQRNPTLWNWLLACFDSQFLNEQPQFHCIQRLQTLTTDMVRLNASPLFEDSLSNPLCRPTFLSHVSTGRALRPS